MRREAGLGEEGSESHLKKGAAFIAAIAAAAVDVTRQQISHVVSHATYKLGVFPGPSAIAVDSPVLRAGRACPAAFFWFAKLGLLPPRHTPTFANSHLAAGVAAVGAALRRRCGRVAGK